jgi:hypothetical protein
MEWLRNSEEKTEESTTIEEKPCGNKADEFTVASTINIQHGSWHRKQYMISPLGV